MVILDAGLATRRDCSQLMHSRPGARIAAQMIVSIAKRIVQVVVTLVLASTVVFALIHASGDPTQGFMPPGASPELREATRDRLGLNDPMALQYVRFIGKGLVGDFGDSWRDQQSALQSVADRLPATLALAGVAMVVSVGFGIVVGVVSASSRAGWVIGLVRTIPLVGQAVPTFWLGAMLMLIFAVRLGWLPASGNATPASIILPAVTLALQPASIMARLMSTGMQDIARSDYVRTAESKGLPASIVSWRHIVPNALLPVLGYAGLQAGFLVGGTVVIESLFAWPGVGRLALQSATQHDLPVIHAFVAVTAIGVITINLLVDLLSLAIDPRQRDTTARGLANG
jgi:peptide/nickel transport system permease protein